MCSVLQIIMRPLCLLYEYSTTSCSTSIYFDICFYRTLTDVADDTKNFFKSYFSILTQTLYTISYKMKLCKTFCNCDQIRSSKLFGQNCVYVAVVWLCAHKSSNLHLSSTPKANAKQSRRSSFIRVQKWCQTVSEWCQNCLNAQHK